MIALWTLCTSFFIGEILPFQRWDGVSSGTDHRPLWWHSPVPIHNSSQSYTERRPKQGCPSCESIGASPIILSHSLQVFKTAMAIKEKVVLFGRKAGKWKTGGHGISSASWTTESQVLGGSLLVPGRTVRKTSLGDSQKAFGTDSGKNCISCSSRMWV
jgi:hypothetical protein